MWSVGGEEREVAVKSLADGSTEEKCILFLQEAAIVGQFKHPNVITLHGVLMEHELVSSKLYTIRLVLHQQHLIQMMIVVEMMEVGDLQTYLCSLHPL